MGSMLSQEYQNTIQQKLDAPLSYGGGSALVAFSFADLATLSQQIGMVLGCLIFAFKLYRDIEKYLQERANKKAGNKNDTTGNQKS